MRILMTGGGTAGHIYPALSIAALIARHHPSAQFLFVGAKGRMETVLVPAAGYELCTMDVRGFQRHISVKNIGRNLAAAYRAITAGRDACRILERFRPDLAIGTGGYVCGPILRQAEKRGIPVVLHESNAYPGVTTKMLAKKAAAVLIGNEAAKQYLPPEANVIVTGNPLRPGFLTGDRIEARRALSLDDRPVLLSYGGSLGAAAINRAMAGVIEHNQQQGMPLQILHGAGRGGYDEMLRTLKAAGISPDGKSVRVLPFLEDMPQYMAAADLVVCRCGAMTMSELPAAGKPAILIPSPYVAENHQFFNAQALASRGAAVCIEENNLTADGLWQTVREIAMSPERLKAMGTACAALSVKDADERIYAVIRQILSL